MLENEIQAHQTYKNVKIKKNSHKTLGRKIYKNGRCPVLRLCRFFPLYYTNDSPHAYRINIQHTIGRIINYYYKKKWVLKLEQRILSIWGFVVLGATITFYIKVWIMRIFWKNVTIFKLRWTFSNQLYFILKIFISIFLFESIHFSYQENQNLTYKNSFFI